MRFTQLVEECLRILNQRIDHASAGRGYEPISPHKKLEWPTAFALHASAESQLFRTKRMEESRSNAVTSVRRLLELAGSERFAGWGIPIARDSMRTGVPHPAETALAVPSAFAIIAICDAYPYLDIADKAVALAAVRKTILVFLREKRLQPDGSFFLLYSSDSTRDWSVTNSNALLAGAFFQAATQLPIAMPELVDSTSRIANWVLGAARDLETINTHWPYYSQPGPSDGRDGKPNDLIHESFTLSGLSLLPSAWLTTVASPVEIDVFLHQLVQRFYSGGGFRDFPVNYTHRIANRLTNGRPGRLALSRRASLGALGALADVLGKSMSDTNLLQKTCLPLLDEIKSRIEDERLTVRHQNLLYRGMVRLSCRAH